MWEYFPRSQTLFLLGLNFMMTSLIGGLEDAWQESPDGVSGWYVGPSSGHPVFEESLFPMEFSVIYLGEALHLLVRGKWISIWVLLVKHHRRLVLQWVYSL